MRTLFTLVSLCTLICFSTDFLSGDVSLGATEANIDRSPSLILDTIEEKESPLSLTSGGFYIEQIKPTLTFRFPTREGTTYSLEVKDHRGLWVPYPLSPLRGTGEDGIFHIPAKDEAAEYRIRARTANRQKWEVAMREEGQSLEFPDGLQLHLDANAEETLHLIDDRVFAWHSLTGDIHFESWKDHSPLLKVSDEDSPIGPARSLLFNKASLDGASPGLRELFREADGITFFGVGKNRGSGSQSYLRVTTGDSDLKVRADFMRTLSDHRFRGRNQDGDGLQTVVGGNRENDVWSIDTTVVDYQNGEVILYQNGELSGSTLDFQTPGKSDMAAPRRIRLGSDTRDEPRFFYDGEIASILIFDRRLSRDEINTVGLYLGEKYHLDFTPVLEETIAHQEEQSAQVDLRMVDGHRYRIALDYDAIDWDSLPQLSLPMPSDEERNPIRAFQESRPLTVREALKTTGERLYNNIILPREWPPKTQNPDTDQPMRVPYLEEPPEVIDVTLGRQLFVDDFLISESSLNRRFHYPNPYKNNPVIRPETAFELQRTSGREGEYEAVTYLGHGGFFYDPHSHNFQIYYTAGWRGPLALATSRDLIDWDRPDLDGKGNNIAWEEGAEAAGWDNSLWLDIEQEPTENRIYYLTQRPGASHTLHMASDDHNWSEGVETGIAADYTSFFYNPFRDVWAFSIKRNTSRGRARDYAENQEFFAEGVFDNSVFWVNADRNDPPDPEVGDTPQLYSLNAVAYESLLLGIFYIHRGPNNSICEEGRFPKNTDLHLAYSRDGFHWHRPDRQPFLEGSRIKDEWDRGYLHSTTGVLSVVGDQLIFPYTGFSGLSPTGHRGMYNGATIGLATLRRDGFASLYAGSESAKMTTVPMRFEGQHLFVNIDNPKGELQVEILDSEGQPIPGFTMEDAEVLSTDSTLEEVVWRSGLSLGELRGQTIRLRFHLQDGDLYSFWFSPDPSGASNGFVGAGGPGFKGFQDTVGSEAYKDPQISKIKEALLQ